MSESTTPVEEVKPAATAPETPAAVTPPPETPAATPADEVEKWKALSRKNEQRAKDNEAAAKRLAEIEEANKSESEKLQARVDAAEKTAADATSKALRSEVSAAKGIPAALLTGSTQEELEASADALLAFKGGTPKAPPATAQGNVGEAVSGEAQQLSAQDVSKLYADKKYGEIEKARQEGRLKTVLGG